MVKFTRHFEGQLVPEWKHAFVDYCLLKNDLKRMQQQQHSHCHGLITTQETNQKQQPSSSLSRWLLHCRLPFFGSSNVPTDHGGARAIQVRRRLTSSGSGAGDVSYETELPEQQVIGTDTGTEAAAREFFGKLDAQLDKVNRFYRGKEKEFLERGESLRRQLEILLDLNATAAASSSGGSIQEPSVSCSLAYSEDESTRHTSTKINIMDQTHQGTDPDTTQEDKTATVPEGLDGSGSFESLGWSAISYQRKTNMKINIPLTTPSRTISALTDLVWDDLHVNQSKKCTDAPEGKKRSTVDKTELRLAEKMIKAAFVELYKGLGDLATYRNLNMMAFVKILTKFEKVTGKQVVSVYLKVAETSYFNCSGEALELMDEVEDTFVRHFAGHDRRKAMKYLKPTQRKESHTLTFFTGLLAGCFALLFTGYCVVAHVAGVYTRHRRDDAMYMETAYPVLSVFSLLFLHLFLYGCNIVAWRKARVNYGFILELPGAGAARGPELEHRDVFLVCAASMAAVAGVMLAHLSLVVSTDHQASPRVQAIPGILLLVFLLLLFCPFNVVYRSNRFRFLGILRNIALSPLYKVAMVDFFMADQLCSQVPMLRNLEYVACYYISGSYTTQEYGYCTSTKHVRDLAYAVSFLPYYWRAMQCARRWFDEADTGHLVNLGKYVVAMLAAGAKVAYEKDRNLGSLSLLIAVSSAATLYQLYWDFVKDWGLLQPNSKNPWLRNELVLKRKSIYYLSMGLNLVLRLAWLQTVIHANFGGFDSRVTSFFLAALEVIRRGHWNFYRLENEHLNNAGKFRAVKTVPLPFHEVDED